MTDEQILAKAIEKAEKNGYDSERPIITNSKNWYYEVIFSHNFAEALWEECKTWIYFNDGEPMDSVNELPSEKLLRQEWWTHYEEADGWQYHLQQMVLLTDDEKFKYLEKFL